METLVFHSFTQMKDEYTFNSQVTLLILVRLYILKLFQTDPQIMQTVWHTVSVFSLPIWLRLSNPFCNSVNAQLWRSSCHESLSRDRGSMFDDMSARQVIVSHIFFTVTCFPFHCVSWPATYWSWSRRACSSRIWFPVTKHGWHPNNKYVDHKLAQ